jgi:hypothetical protein
VNEPKRSEELEQLAALARGAARGPQSDGEERLQRAAYMARVDSTLASPRLPRKLLAWSLPLVAAAALILVWAQLWQRDLTFEVQGAQRDGGYIRASGDRPAALTFSDQTTVLAAPGARLRVEALDQRGAQVLVERGHADVHVVHRPSSAWTFIAGSFTVAVTGTRFSLDWDPTSETLELALLEGSVEVRGAAGTGPWAVRAGQHFHGDLQRSSMLVADLAKLAASEAAPSGAEPAAVAPTLALPAPAAPSGAPPHGPLAKTESWTQRIARGEFEEIVKEAEARGTAGCLAGCSAADLRALSDAARYTGKSDLAEQSLLALRKRFGANQGRDASFLLGRLEERRGSLAAATSWYDTYLREAPGGSFAAEALAGKMRAVRATSGASAAAPLARDYLARFPKGVHVNTAREILDGK